MAKRLSKQQLREKQALEDKKFRRILRNGIIISILVIALLNIFYIHWCDTRFFFKKHTFYGKILPPEMVCEVENSLKHHKTLIVVVNDKLFYVCGAKCKHYMTHHYKQYAFSIDAFTGDSISKANAIIGLKEKGQTLIAYFRNEQTFKKYYEQRNK